MAEHANRAASSSTLLTLFEYGAKFSRHLVHFGSKGKD
jgi:hypothetical protein